MKENFETLAAQILAAIKESKNVLLHFHPGPDPDSCGSALAMLHFLESQGKRVTLIKGDSSLPDFVSFLPGHEKVVEKSYAEIDANTFDLFVILDSGDLSRVSNLAPIIFPPSMKTILIDHHATTKPFANINFVDTKYAATAEMLTKLLLTWQAEITPDIARCLLLGVYSDTGGFKFSSTTGETFQIAAELASRAPDYHQIIFNLENNRPAGAIRYQALAFSSVQTYFNNQVAIASLTTEELSKNNLTENDAASVSIPNILKSVTGWDVAIGLTEWRSGHTSASIRTRNSAKYDASLLANALGGGGHKAAAGADIPKPLAEARNLVLEKLKEVYPWLS